jgi:hypothetical protein
MPDDTSKVVVRQTNGKSGPIGTAAAGTDAATQVIAVPGWKIGLVRVARVYFQTVLGVLTADGIGVIQLSSTHDLWDHLLKAAIVGLAPSAIASLQEVLEVLSSFDVRYPQLRG